jgi:hypothetical protein
MTFLSQFVTRYSERDDLFPEELLDAALPHFVDWLLENVTTSTT